MAHPTGTSALRKAALPFGVACLVLAGLFGRSATTGMFVTSQIQHEQQRTARMTELGRSMTDLNEWLTMAARLAVLSGETRWIERYNEVGRELDADITQAVLLADPSIGQTLRETLDEASHDLLRVQHAAFRLGASGNRSAALALLDGPEATYLEDSYRTGIDGLGQSLLDRAAQRTSRLAAQTRVITDTALGSVVLLGVLLLVGAQLYRRKLARRTAAASLTDQLTDLPNRRALFLRMQARLTTTGRGVALLVLDLTGFRRVNELHGHRAGDALLGMVTARLRAATRDGELLARLGGAEFAVAIDFEESLSDDKVAGATEIASDRLARSLEAPFALADGVVVAIGARFGAAFGQAGRDDADALFGHADLALHQAKAVGAKFHLYSSDLDDRLRERARLEADLRHAIDNDEIEPFFQPLVGIAGREIVGFEALARWSGPDGSQVAPADFIPMAEELGLIDAMSRHLLRRACIAAAGWPAGILLTFNVSPLQLQDLAYPAEVAAVLQETGLQPGQLEIEITESALVSNFSRATAVITELKLLGIRLALDDFGTGFSSLLHLQKLPFDTIKIDRSFITGIAVDLESRKIVASVIGLGRSLGMTIVAEGIEQDGTADILDAMGCDIGQGWLFGKPVSAASTGYLIETRAAVTHAANVEPARPRGPALLGIC